MKLLYIIFCMLICAQVHSQILLVKQLHFKSINNTPQRKTDSLKQLLSGINLAVGMKPVNKLLLRNKTLQKILQPNNSLTDNCNGYFCNVGCVNTIDSARAAINPVCANTTTTLTAYGVTGINPIITWWTGRGGTGTNLGTGSTLPNSAAGMYYVRVTSQCVAAEDSVRVDSFPGKSDTTAVVCNSFTWHGVTYYHTGDKMDTVTTALGCDSIITLHLTILSIPNTFSKTNTGCYGSATGSITITPTSGLAPFTYRIGTVGPIAATSGTFNNLKAGTYRAYVQDATGCIGVAAPIVIAQSAKVGATVTATPVSNCYGGTNGKITISNPVGVAPFKYRLGGVGSYTSFTAPYTITGLKAANYNVYIQDANGCVGTAGAVAVLQPEQVIVNYGTVSITCATLTGAIVLTSPNSPGATFKLNPGGFFTTQFYYGNLQAGTYYGYAKDTRGCIGRSQPIMLLAPTGCVPAIVKATQQAAEANTQSFEIYLSPNPSNYQFLLKAKSNSTQQLTIRVIDANGRTVYETKGPPDQLYKFGETLNNGLYLIEVRQGDKVKTLKAVKGR